MFPEERAAQLRAAAGVGLPGAGGAGAVLRARALRRMGPSGARRPSREQRTIIARRVGAPSSCILREAPLRPARRQAHALRLCSGRTQHT